jgi:phage repressor protein C with HTH and peptisase S24 domain
MGSLEADQAPAGRTVPIRYVVGSSDEIVPASEPQTSRIELPPGLEDAEALEVHGRWLVPLYHEKDVLLYRRVEIDPLHFRDEVAVVQLKSGKRYLRFVQPSDRKGRFTIVSFNPAIPRLEDQQIAWVGPILWVRKRSRT